MDKLTTIKGVLYLLSGISVRGLEDTKAMATCLEQLIALRDAEEKKRGDAA